MKLSLIERQVHIQKFTRFLYINFYKVTYFKDGWTPNISNQPQQQSAKLVNAADNFPAQELKRGNEAHEVLEDLDYPDLTAKREELLQRLTQILEVNCTQNYTGSQFLENTP